MANRGPNFDKHVFSIKDLEEQASKKLPKMYRDYYNEGAMDLLTLEDNRRAFDRYKIRPRVLAGSGPDVDTTTVIMGKKTTFPLGFSPAAMHALAHPDGEKGTSRAAAKMGVAMGLSTYSNHSIEDVMAESRGNPYAFQVTMLKDKQLVIDMMKRAEDAGFDAIFLTVDCPVLGKRLNEYRNSFTMPKGTTYPNLGPDISFDSLEDSGDRVGYESGMDWAETAKFMRQHTKLPVWIKGVYTSEDVILAIRHGFDGVIISNHGGRQLDGVPSTLDALRECAPVAKGKIPIAIDGGIRRGTDIFKAVALGADYCFVGRVPIWGLAYNGSEGVELALKLLLHEFSIAMALTGCKTVSDITRSHLSILDVTSTAAEQITATLHAYGAALKSRNVEEALSLYTSDGVILAPHFPASVGAEALRESYARIFASVQLTIAFQVEEIVVQSEEWAFARTTAAGTKTMLQTQESETHSNQELFLMKKEEGRWKIARYAFSSMKPLVQNGVRRS